MSYFRNLKLVILNNSQFNKILLILVIFSSIGETEIVTNQEQNVLYRGPNECGDVLANHFELFTEYPISASSKINFLNWGDSCNYAAEKLFIDELLTTFLNGTDNSQRMLKLKEIWERWRARTDSGSLGQRICNPKRMLECHFSLAKCVCRSTFKLFDVPDFKANEQIIIDIVRETKLIPYSNINDIAVICKAKIDAACRWNVPWLGFCSIPCANLDANTPSYCVGLPNDIRRCRVCNPAEDILGEPGGKFYKCQLARQIHGINFGYSILLNCKIFIISFPIFITFYS